MVLLAFALCATACSRGDSPPLKVGVYGALRRLGGPIAGSVVAVSPKGTPAASAHTRVPGPGFELSVPSGSTYTIRGTASDGSACAPVTISIPRLTHSESPEPPWTVRPTSCGRSRVP